MKISQITKLAVVAALSIGIQACSKDKKDKAVPAGPVGEQSKADACPVGAEGTWLTTEKPYQALEISRVEGVLTIKLPYYDESISVNGQAQILTPNRKGHEDNKVEITASCEDSVVLVSEKDADGDVVSSKWQLTDKADGSITTFKKDGSVDDTIKLRLMPVDREKI